MRPRKGRCGDTPDATEIAAIGRTHSPLAPDIRVLAGFVKQFFVVLIKPTNPFLRFFHLANIRGAGNTFLFHRLSIKEISLAFGEQEDMFVGRSRPVGA